MNDTTSTLRALAQRNADLYRQHTQPCAVLLSGSVAEGYTDHYSDIDMSMYYHTMPSAEAVQAAQQAIAGERLNVVGDLASGAIIEFYYIDGIQCQVIHETLERVTLDLAEVLDKHDAMSVQQKACEGILKAIPLYGEDIIRDLKARVALYPEPLARAMVEKGLQISPMWRLGDYLAPRDATIWRHEMLVEAAYHILRVLAGLNRIYFSAFQFKRMTRWTSKLTLAPDNLAPRLESLFHSDVHTSLDELERLVADTVTLVEQHMPDVDTSKLRGSLGKRVTAW